MSVRLLVVLGLAAVAMTGAAAGVAQAQMISPMLYEGPRILLQDHADPARPDDRAPGARNRPGTAAPAAVDPAALRYTPSKARRTANLKQFVAKTRAADPAGAADLERMFAEGDVIERIGTALAPYGLRIDDLADAYTVYWINAWQATRGTNAETSRATNAAVRAQAAQALAATPGLLRAADATKQELAESLLVQAALIDAAVTQARGDAARLRAVGAAVAEGARSMGLDLGAVELTEQGFVRTRQRG
ncbi:DUF6683 family protein [Azospirillum thermophilum]|uniref:Uncharacterized protein n=1 Tax=Azospirillum thermophilum TaxID=2202148 RepID=A0A2S2CNK2_9PROT|nr:DUF6683 family protein [Azospirillum thermophilum]AWK85897.1 hypothetical protein DEW08_06130 [Azospirillum thermophilum]